MYVRMVGVTVNSAERNRSWKRLLQELVCEIANLRVCSENIERQDYAVVSPSSLGLFELLFGAEVCSNISYLLFESSASIGGGDPGHHLFGQ